MRALPNPSYLEMRRRSRQFNQPKYKDYIHKLNSLIVLIKYDTENINVCEFATASPEDNFCSFCFIKNNPDGATLSKISNSLEETSMNIHNVLEKSIKKLKPKLVAEGLMHTDERDLDETEYLLSEILSNAKGE